MAELNLVKESSAPNRWNITFLILSICVFLYSIYGDVERLLRGVHMDFYHTYEAGRAVMLGTFRWQ